MYKSHARFVSFVLVGYVALENGKRRRPFQTRRNLEKRTPNLSISIPFSTKQKEKSLN